MIERINRNGMVAVAVSEGYGGGWSTWNDVDPLDAKFNELFLNDDWIGAEKLCDHLKLGYSGGAYQVQIHWIPEGTEFIISEYDGAEEIRTKDSFSWRTA